MPVTNAEPVVTLSAILLRVDHQRGRSPEQRALSGSINPTFGSVTVLVLSPASNFNINGNLVNNGTLNASVAP